MGCIKLHILNERYESTELKVSCINKALTSDLGAGNVRRVMGYMYFGARYYDSELSIWLSVDPLAWKYPHQTNYVYCSNNPIRIIDPDGRDEWDLMKDGVMKRRENGRTDIDIVHAVDAKGNNVSSEFKAGTITEMNQGTGRADFGNGVQSFNYEYIDIKGDVAGTQFFEFAAQNTNIEWAHIQTGVDDNRIGYTPNLMELFGYDLSDPAGGNMVKDFIKSGVNVRNDVHSHPSIMGRLLNSGPGPGDFNYAGWAKDQYGTKAPPTSVYSKQNGRWGYTPFHPLGIIKP